MGTVTRNSFDEEFQSKVLTFDQLTTLEPKLWELYRAAKAIKDDRTKPSFCANAHWYGYVSRPHDGGLKAQLVELVGWCVQERGGDPRLATCQAYDVAYQTIYDVLPGCRNCQCLPIEDVIAARREMARERRRR